MDQQHHQSSVSTAGQIMRKLSHSKIVVHFPIICDKSGKKDGTDLISLEEPENEKIGNIDFDEESPPEIQIRKGLKSKLKGLTCVKYLGLVLALFASVIISLMTLIVKTMPQYHAFSLVLWRLQGVLFPSIFFISYLRCKKRQPIFDSFLPVTAPGKWVICALLMARGIFGCSADIFQYSSLKYLSLADSSVIAFSTPIFVTFAAYFVLGEKLGIVPVVTGAMSLIGVVIISRPPILTGEASFNTEILIGNFLALGCMMMATLTFVVLRSLKNVHFALTTCSFGFIGSVESLILCWVTATFELPNGSQDWLMVVVIAVMYFVGQLCFTLALQLEECGPVALIRSCDIILAYIWQYLFLNVVPDFLSVVGGAVVISGILVTATRKFIQELPDEDARRQKFWFLLK